MKGWRDYEVVSWSSEQPDLELFGKVKVKMVDIPGYFNDYYHSAIEIYNSWKRYGRFPNERYYGTGYADQPEYITDIIDVFETTIEASRSKK